MKYKVFFVIGLLLATSGCTPHKTRRYNSVAPVVSANFHEAPLLAMSTGHLGQPYQDTVVSGFDTVATSYQIASGSLPMGLSLNPNTGIISGTPLQSGVGRFRVIAYTSGGVTHEAIASLAIFDAGESAIVPKQNFGGIGSYLVTKHDEILNWTSSFDGLSYTSHILIYQPENKGNAPLMVFHRGRGFNYNDYHNFLTKIASYGVVCASVADDNSFYAPENQSTLVGAYNYGRAELGMESASAAQEATLNYVLDLSENPLSYLYQAINHEAVFLSGHSRGGGATQASHSRGVALKICGVIYYMAFDLRFFQEAQPPGVAPAYPIADKQPRIPSLIFSAENDGDLVYPYCDEIIDRAVGPTTFVTVYGGVHNYLSDFHAAEGYGTISRDEEQDRIANFTVAFIKRWSEDNISLDGFLYGNEYATSATVGVASWRRASPTLMVDDFQGAAGTNLLGGAKIATGATLAQDTPYPPLASLGNLGLQAALLNPLTSTYDFTLNFRDQDVSQYRYLLSRIEQRGPFGWQTDAYVTLSDSIGQTASIQISEASGDTTSYLPGWPSPTSTPLNRFVNLSLSLNNFRNVNPALNLTKITQIKYTVGRIGIVLDDIRFE